jgi:ribosome-interacting GTPase 1
MPANLTPQYLAADQRFKQATSIPEKIEALEEMMALIPKHKGTEKMQAALRQRMARLLEEKEKRYGVSKASAMYSVPREGAGQAVLIGAPNAGKSSLLARLTKATPAIADYPFTTRLPQPGMMPYEEIQIQLVDLPPVAPEVYKPWIGSIVRQADLVLLTADLGSDDVLEQVDGVLKILEDSKIHLIGDAMPEPSAAPPGVAFCRTLLVANKSDAVQAAETLEILRDLFQPRFAVLPTSTVTGEGLEKLRRVVFERLEIIRIYTKVPGKKLDPAAAPFVLKRGSTVLDAAGAIHRDLVHTLRFARIWSSPRSEHSVKHEGQMVERTHQLEDGDILELHK